MPNDLSSDTNKRVTYKILTGSSYTYYFIPVVENMEVRDDGIYEGDTLKYSLDMFVPLKVRINYSLLTFYLLKEPFDFDQNISIDNSNFILESDSFEICQNKLVRSNFESKASLSLTFEDDLLINFNYKDGDTDLSLLRYYKISSLIKDFNPSGFYAYFRLFDSDKFVYTLWGNSIFYEGYYTKDNRVFKADGTEDLNETRNLFGSDTAVPILSPVKVKINGNDFTFYLIPGFFGDEKFSSDDIFVINDGKLTEFKFSNSDIQVDFFDSVNILKIFSKSDLTKAIYVKMEQVVEYINKEFPNLSPSESSDSDLENPEKDEFDFAGKVGNINLDENVLCTLYPGLYFKVKKVTILQTDYNYYTFTYVLQTFGKIVNSSYLPNKTLQKNIVFVPSSTVYKG